MSGKHTPGPWRAFYKHKYDEWHVSLPGQGLRLGLFQNGLVSENREADAHLIAAAPDLLDALHEGRRAIGDHHAPADCYATGPMTGDAYRDLVECPACSFIAKYDAAIAKAEGRS